MALDRTVKRYLTQPDVVRGCKFKRPMSREQAVKEAVAKGLRSYHCTFGRHWHIGHSRHLKRFLSERRVCPKGCQRQVRTQRLEAHLSRCPGYPIEGSS